MGPRIVSTRILIGLGNPGAEYAETRHNVGFRVLDRVAERIEVSYAVSRRMAWGTARRGMDRIVLVKPLTYMNRSGLAVAEICDRFEAGAEHVLVVVDDLHLPPGRLRIRRRGSDGGHNGLRSIAEALESEAFARLRVGIGRPPEEDEIGPGESGPGRTRDFVLGRFSPVDLKNVECGVRHAVDAAEAWLDGADLQDLMNTFNRKPTDLSGPCDPGTGADRPERYSDGES
jgi:PTH1 family peptidyl-tRNA hydrolase